MPIVNLPHHLHCNALHQHHQHYMYMITIYSDQIEEHLVTAHDPHHELNPFQFGLSHQSGLNLEVREKHKK